MEDVTRRYGSRRRAFSLCLLLAPEAPGAHPCASTAAPTSDPAIRAAERDGLVLHSRNRGGIQLRDRTKRRIIEAVSGVEIAISGTLER